MIVSGQTIKLTVILFDNNVPDGKKMVADTLFNKKEINLSNISVDIFYSCSYFHLPYYVPTDGILKNAAKAKECDMKIYPQTVKCYEYDAMNRVIKMNVSGSGTMNNFIYKYNDKSQITEINDLGSMFILKYNPDGTLSELTESVGVTKKKLIFNYE